MNYACLIKELRTRFYAKLVYLSALSSVAYFFCIVFATIPFHVVIWMGLGSLLSGCGALWKVMCSGFIKSDGMSAVLGSPTVISSIAKVGKKV